MAESFEANPKLATFKLRQVVQWHDGYPFTANDVLFTYDLYYYSEAALFGRIDPVLWQVRGVVVALAVPLIGLGIVRTREQPIQLNISRRLVFHTGILVAAGFYLLLMSAAGFYIRNFAGEWGSLLRVLFWITSLILLAVLAFCSFQLE